MNKKTLVFLFLIISPLLIGSLGFVKAIDENIGVIPTYWGGYTIWGQNEVYYGGMGYTGQITHVDNSVLHDGHTSIRIDSPANVNNSARELNWGGYPNNNWSIPVNGGDQFYFSCWIKTGSSTVGQNGNTSRGGIIGVDLYSNNNRVWEYAHGTTTDFTYQQFQYYSSYVWVPYNSDWTKIIINFTIPTKEFTTDDYGNPFDPSVTINYVIPWLTGSWQDQNELASVWFSDAEIYINPTESHGTEINQNATIPNTGIWDYVSQYAFYANGSLHNNTNISGFANYTYGQIGTLTPQKGIQLNIDIETLRGEKYQWYWSSGVKRFFTALEMTNGTNSVYALIYFAHEKGMIITTSELKFGTKQQYVIKSTGALGYVSLFDDNDKKFAVQMVTNVNNTINVNYLWSLPTFDFTINETHTAEGNRSLTENTGLSLTGNITVNIYFGHEGNGVIKGSFSGLIVSNNMTTFQDITTIDGIVQENWLEKAWAFLSGIFDLVITIFDMAIKIFSTVLPYLPWIGLLYIIDAGIMSLKTQSFQPIGLLFLTAWNMFSTVVLWGIYLIQAIASLIPF